MNEKVTSEIIEEYYFPETSKQIRYQKYYANYELHRLDGPACIAYYKSGKILCEMYYINDKRHRLNGPAWTRYKESGQIDVEEYYINGILHRIDGPAEIYYYESGDIKSQAYIINNIRLYELGKYCSQKEKLFEYVRKYPQHIEEIKLLAYYNHWLNEKELKLLTCMDMFI